MGVMDGVAAPGEQGGQESQLVSCRCKPFVECCRNTRLVNITETESNNGDLSGTEFVHAHLRRGGLGRLRKKCCPEFGSSRDGELVH